MKLRIGYLLALVGLGTLSSSAQHFCQHMRMQQQTAMMNTIDNRVDTFDVQSYTINAAFLNYQAAQQIEATTLLDVVLLQASSSITLDLLGLNVTEVKVNDAVAAFSYTSPVLKIALPSIAVGETFNVSIAYDGSPQSDARWGGFYFTGEYAFNLGVGFDADPHNFGRVWFPCFDNFVDRATYYTNVTVDSGKSAYANGLLTEVVDNGDKTFTYKWSMDDPIPTYLASVAIADYEEVKMDANGIPIVLTALKEDTANLRSSFENLPACVANFIDVYGSHSFDRIGFNIVPFNGGAMEHATNIAYPRYAIDGGGKENETLFAHELAHHWWGNTTTCKTQEDMWLNEGWASYSERIFLENIYGRAAYDQDIENNHRQVLQFAHIQDGAVLPVSGVDHANTYGRHVYNKGADMVHSLRGMMGDEAFFAACKGFQMEFKFREVTTDSMRLFFNEYTPKDLTGFFERWIEEPGFAHFDIIRTFKENDRYRVHVKQTPRFNTVNYRGTIATLTAFSADWKRFDSQILIFNKEQTFNVNCPFEPVYWAFDFDDLISDALTTDWAVFQPGETVMDMEQGMISKLDVNNTSTDSVLVRVEHHWAPVDGTFGAPKGVVLSRQRYWSVNGIWGDDVSLSGELTYSGLQSNSLKFGYLDDELIRITEDSLVLLYRADASKAWELATDYTKNTGSLFDKRGTIQISDLKKGQYCLAMYDSDLAGGEELEAPSYSFTLFPNPAKEVINVAFEREHSCCTLEVTNLQGHVVYTEEMSQRTKKKVIDISQLTPGIYFLGVVTENLAYDVKRFVVE